MDIAIQLQAFSAHGLKVDYVFYNAYTKTPIYKLCRSKVEKMANLDLVQKDEKNQWNYLWYHMGVGFSSGNNLVN